MITVSATQLDTAIDSVFWPFVRIGACFMVAPVFGAVAVPAQLRIVLAGAIALLIAPLIPQPPAVSALSAAGALITVQQVIIGVALGFCLQILFAAISLGGQLIANGMGLSLAYNLDPLEGAATPALGQLYTVFATLIFLLLHGELALIRVLVQGFRSLPVGTAGLGAQGIWTVVNWGSMLFSGALAVALPGVTALLVANLAFGVVSRAAPSMNLFAVGLPISLVFGLLVIIAGLPALGSGFTRLLADTLILLRHLSGT